MQPTLLADEERRAERSLELLDARRHVRLHAVELARGGADAALVGDGLEHLQGSEVHDSRIENEVFMIIRLPGWSSQPSIGWPRFASEVAHGVANGSHALARSGVPDHSGPA